jgi:hypothetical protein
MGYIVANHRLLPSDLANFCHDITPLIAKKEDCISLSLFWASPKWLWHHAQDRKMGRKAEKFRIS